MHAPWYNTNYNHQGEGEAMRLAMEELLYEHGVDLVFAGARCVWWWLWVVLVLLLPLLRLLLSLLLLLRLVRLLPYRARRLPLPMPPLVHPPTCPSCPLRRPRARLRARPPRV